MQVQTNERIALVRYFAGISISTYDSLGQLFEFIIRDYFNELRRETNVEAALQIIQDIVTRQSSILKDEWAESSPSAQKERLER